MAKHYLLGPSSADRWTACPGSLFGQVVESRVSAASQEGSCCHALLNITLQYITSVGEGGWPAAYTHPAELFDTIAYKAGEFARGYIGKTWDLFDREATSAIPVTVEMVDSVVLFVQTISALIIEHQMTAPHVWSEELMCSGLWIAPSGQPPIEEGEPLFGGTTDCLIFCRASGVLCVLDLKFGRKPVIASSLQTTAYALLCMERMQGFNLKVSRVVQVIVQPRCNPAVSKFLPGSTDIQIAWEKIKRTATAVLGRWHRLRQDLQAGEEDLLQPGPHCQYCPRALTCSANQDMARASLDVGVVPDAQNKPSYALTRDLTVEQLMWFSERADAFRDFLKRVERALYERAVAGTPIPGYKLVAKYGHREWVDPTNVGGTLALLYGGEPGDYTTTTPVSPAQAEKKIKTSGGDWELAQTNLVRQRINGLTLVPEEARGQAVLPEAAQTFLLQQDLGDD